MGPQVVWLMVSYGFMTSIGLAFLEAGNSVVAYALLILCPAVRVARRFRVEGRYRLIRGAGKV